MSEMPDERKAALLAELEQYTHREYLQPDDITVEDLVKAQGISDNMARRVMREIADNEPEWQLLTVLHDGRARNALRKVQA